MLGTKKVTEVLKAPILNEMYNHMHFSADFHPTGKHP